VGHNARVSKCCDLGCLRDVMKISHGVNTDIGGEIHAEQSVLVKQPQPLGYATFLVTGFDRNGNELLSKDAWPCYVCSRMIKFAGYKTVWVKGHTAFEIYSISYILEEYEKGWHGVLGDI
jgi:deoxycytidylate deaminase